MGGCPFRSAPAGDLEPVAAPRSCRGFSRLDQCATDARPAAALGHDQGRDPRAAPALGQERHAVQRDEPFLADEYAVLTTKRGETRSY